MFSPVKRDNFVRLHGYILPHLSGAEDEGEDEDANSGDEFETPDSRQMNALAGGADFPKPMRISRKSVQMRLMSDKSNVEVEGYFLYDKPWWEATFKVKRTQVRKKYMQGFPGYVLRSDSAVGPTRLVNLFLQHCDVNQQHVLAFNNYLRRVRCEERVTFMNLPEYLQNFSNSSEEAAGIVKNVSQHLEHDGRATFVKHILQYDLADLYLYLPQLLPRQFVDIVTKRSIEELQSLQHSLRERPWLFGFSTMLSYHHKLLGCEAPSKSFYHSDQIDRIPVVERDALHIYHVLKHDCNQYGHTFLKLQRLKNSKEFQDLNYKVNNWNLALEFLINNKVIIKEEDQIYLKSLWWAEESIAKGVASLFQKHLLNPCTFDLDLESLKQMKDDSDQLLAAYLCSQSPLVVISGKGGCGKTTVVSKVFMNAERQICQSQAIKNDCVGIVETGTDEHNSSVGDTKSNNHCHDLIPPGGATSSWQNQDLHPEGSNMNRSHAIEDLPAGGSFDDVSIEELTPPDESHIDEDKTKDFHTILMTAPTGKAANLLGKRSHLPSFTLHQIIFSFKFFVSKNKGNPEAVWKHSKVQVLITDESSLVSVRTFSSVLNILLENAELQKVILLGDVNQLPSIEPGNFMSDFFKSLQKIGCSIVLRTNHRSESKLIIDNASKIAECEMPTFSPAGNFHFIQIPDLSQHNSLSVGIVEAIKKLLKQEDFAKGSERQHQFVAFRNNDCDNVNELCCKHYVGHSIRDHKKKKCFQVGDKVCCMKNGNLLFHNESTIRDDVERLYRPARLDKTGNSKPDSDSTISQENGSSSQSQLSENNKTQQEAGEGAMEKNERRFCNGEIFFIEKDLEFIDSRGKKHRFLKLRSEEDELFLVGYRELMRACGLKHAWARTIHTYQGSESPTVIYVVGNNCTYQTWQHVYTAVTRGRRKVYIVSRQAELEQAVSRPQKYRNTSLRSRLHEKLGQLPSSVFCSNKQKHEALQRIRTSLEELSPHDVTAAAATSGQDGDTSDIRADTEIVSNNKEQFEEVDIANVNLNENGHQVAGASSAFEQGSSIVCDRDVTEGFFSQEFEVSANSTIDTSTPGGTWIANKHPNDISMEQQVKNNRESQDSPYNGINSVVNSQEAEISGLQSDSNVSQTFSDWPDSLCDEMIRIEEDFISEDEAKISNDGEEQRDSMISAATKSQRSQPSPQISEDDTSFEDKMLKSALYSEITDEIIIISDDDDCDEDDRVTNPNLSKFTPSSSDEQKRLAGYSDSSDPQGPPSLSQQHNHLSSGQLAHEGFVRRLFLDNQKKVTSGHSHEHVRGNCKLQHVQNSDNTAASQGTDSGDYMSTQKRTLLQTSESSDVSPTKQRKYSVPPEEAVSPLRRVLHQVTLH